ncbi:cytokine receptor common subunit gamma-like [Seriola lalandi dorsalis]|uniref:Cytokine receptor common subunit gamma-like n=1 Tax=Seriola lalandi dorsalis TaxID=1841481 RepID=A0A3B4XXM9_SERLL|nr:cytokine receptor common subunit gamma-like [Seriola lalandi dorsalis]
MSRMFNSLDLVVVGCLFLMVESQTGQILPPQYLSQLWREEFQPEFTWAPPKHSVSNCTYRVIAKNKDEDSEKRTLTDSPPWSNYIVMEGGFLNLSVQTICNGKASELASLIVNYPEMVKNLECYIRSSKQTQCSWEAADPTTDLSFFYRLVDEDLTVSFGDEPSPLRECSSYSSTEGVRTGCELQAKVKQIIHIFFNGTVNNTLFRNTFTKDLLDNVKPPPLNWTVIKARDKFIISWIPPDIGNLTWKFQINYTECVNTTIKTIERGTSAHLNLVAHCQYRISIRAKHENSCTQWSDDKYFDADTDPKAMVYLAIIIPLMFAALAILIFVCCRKNKEHIFPKVPQPRDFLSDISDNNNKSTVCDLYIPAKEEENCNITLVMDPQINNTEEKHKQ